MLTIKYFTASWCGPCKMFGPIVDKASMETGVTINKIDVDTNKALTQEYFISSVPTLVFERDGLAVHRHTGVMSLLELKNWISRL